MNNNPNEDLPGDIIPGQYIISVSSSDSIPMLIETFAIRPLSAVRTGQRFIVAELNEQQIELLTQDDRVTEVVPDCHIKLEESNPALNVYKSDGDAQFDIAIIGYGADLDVLKAHGIDCVQFDFTDTEK